MQTTMSPQEALQMLLGVGHQEEEDTVYPTGKEESQTWFLKEK